MSDAIKLAIEPCPFCGHVGLDFREGSTFRWLAAECGGCGATCGETRVQTLGDGTKDEWMQQAQMDAIAVWNTRAALRAQPVPEVGFGNIAQPAAPFKKLSDDEVLWIAQSHGIDVYACNTLAFYNDLISTTQAKPGHSELVKDAARYRWLREQHWSDSKFAVVSNPKTAVNLGSICPSRELLDEAIDEAMAAIGEAT